MNEPRPKITDASVRRAAAEDLYESEIKQWLLRNSGESLASEREATIDELEDVISAGDGDGYAMARRLESYHRWDPDSELVEILDGGHLYSAHSRLVREWVERNAIKPTLAIGMMVRTSHGEGPIVGYYEPEGTYIVAASDEQKERFAVKQSGGDPGPGSTGYILPYEECEPVETPEAEGFI